MVAMKWCLVYIIDVCVLTLVAYFPMLIVVWVHACTPENYADKFIKGGW